MLVPQRSTVMPMKPIRRLFMTIVMGMLDRKMTVTRFQSAHTEQVRDDGTRASSAETGSASRCKPIRHLELVAAQVDDVTFE